MRPPVSTVVNGTNMKADGESNVLKFPYSPRMRICIFCVCGGILWIAVASFEGINPRGLGGCFGLLVILLGLLLILRGLLFKTYLTVEAEAIVIPSGFGRFRVKRVTFASITRVRHFNLPFTAVFQIETHNGEKCEVVSTMLPKNEDYVFVAKLLMERMQT